MRLMYFPVNAAWAFVFGADLRTARPVPMLETLFFQTRQEAVAMAHLARLNVAKDGTVSAE